VHPRLWRRIFVASKQTMSEATMNTLSEKLKEQTKSNHQLLEKKLLKKLKLIRSLDEYAALLTHFYSYFGALEILIDERLDINQLPDYSSRRKTASILNDLKSLNLIFPHLAKSGSLPEICNHFQALGSLYVIEGSTLGGQIINKMLNEQVTGIDPSKLSFFSGYGEHTYKMWNIFKQAIDVITDQEEQKIVIESANNTFFQFSNWFDCNG